MTRIEILSPMKISASVLSRVETCGLARTSEEASLRMFAMAIWTLLSRMLAVIAEVALATAVEEPLFGSEETAALVREAPAVAPVAVPTVPGVRDGVPIFAVQS